MALIHHLAHWRSSIVHTIVHIEVTHLHVLLVLVLHHLVVRRLPMNWVVGVCLLPLSKARRTWDELRLIHEGVVVYETGGILVEVDSIILGV